MEPKIPEEEESSLEPNNSFVNEEDEPVGFLPSISLFLSNESLSRQEREMNNNYIQRITVKERESKYRRKEIEYKQETENI